MVPTIATYLKGLSIRVTKLTFLQYLFIYLLIYLLIYYIFCEGNFPGTSPSHKNITLSSHGFRRNIAPLKFPDLNEYSEDNKSLIPPSGQQPHPSQQPPPKTIGETSANKPHLPPHGDQDSDTQGSASSIGDKEELTLPPIPKRLVPSRSTERIMALLTQQGLATSYGTPEETQNRSSNHQESEEKIREEPLSSTPATRSKPNVSILTHK